jgi:hypothetical protein
MPRIAPLAAAVTALLAPAAEANLQLNELFALTSANGARNGSAEILAYSPDQNTVLSTMGGTSGYGVQVLNLSSTGSLSERGLVTFDSIFGGAGTMNGPSSTAIDPLGRGFGVVSLIPAANGTTPGKIGFFNYRTGELAALNSLDVGFHPDSVKFSADGTKLFVVNEGEFTSGGNTDAPGSISIVDLSGVAGIAGLSGLDNTHVKTFDFQAANLGAGVSLTGLRINDLTTTEPYRHVEPEFLSEFGGKLYVSLQENNAIGVFDLAAEKWSKIHGLGTIVQTVDASDRDGAGGTASAQINDSVAGLPMPDALATFSLGGKTYIVSANEGDFRVDDNDRSRVRDLPTSGSGRVDPGTAAALNAIYGDYRANSNLGRLRISKIDGDTDRDGDIDVLTMTGTRSFSIWDAETGALVKDSGSLENYLLSQDPALHNANYDEANNVLVFDARSPDKGPEPEGLTIGEIDGRRIAFVGMERQNGLVAYDITDPTSLLPLAYVNSAQSGLISPESLLFVPAADSPSGTALILAGYELKGGGIGVYSAVPVPAALPLAASAFALLAGVARRRNRAA